MRSHDRRHAGMRVKIGDLITNTSTSTPPTLTQSLALSLVLILGS